jgi:3-isopropylmalate/(R)-2-methylmalate dehydratase small subunit
VTSPSGEVFTFAVDAERKHRLLNGLDDIGITLQFAAQIQAYETARRQVTPWLFN